MLSATIEEYVNGYAVRVVDYKKYKREVDEIHEERIDALKAIQQWAAREILEELKRRQSNAGQS